ncbi:sarcosine oxidase subunit gamma [Aureimonas psammosilenae]|uniref:sarcosine oxidase subunit gamma n=1 Tax=Aureimonas psammosilenae TaxID=2495496 RepID=UPI0012608DD2|nr:sarcosine oxidase subunit gamma family protein [Aureimonas psammosilenae]
MLQEWKTLSGTRLPSVADRFAVSLAPDQARFSLRVRAASRAAAGEVFGVALPETIGGVHSADGRTAICLGPDEWYLLAPANEVDAICKRFAVGLSGPHSLVDVSHREIGIDVRGSDATLALSSFCVLDLDAMPEGSATRTILDKAQAVLVKHSAHHYRIEVWQSFASHVWGLLAAVGREIATEH